MVLPTCDKLPKLQDIGQQDYRLLLDLKTLYEIYLAEITREFTHQQQLLKKEFALAYTCYTQQFNINLHPLITQRYQQGILPAIAKATHQTMLTNLINAQLQALEAEELLCEMPVIGAQRLSHHLMAVQHASYFMQGDLSIDVRWQLHDDLMARWQALQLSFDSARQQLVDNVRDIIIKASNKQQVIVAIREAIATAHRAIRPQWFGRYNSEHKNLADMLVGFLASNEKKGYLCCGTTALRLINYEEIQGVLLAVNKRIAQLQLDFKQKSSVFHLHLQQQFSQKPFVLIEVALNKLGLLTAPHLLATLQQAWLLHSETLAEDQRYCFTYLQKYYSQELTRLFFMLNEVSYRPHNLTQQRDAFRLAAAFVVELQRLWIKQVLPRHPLESQRLAAFTVVQIWLEKYWQAAILPIKSARLIKSTQLLNFLATPLLSLESTQRQIVYTLYDTLDAQRLESVSHQLMIYKRPSRMAHALHTALNQLEAERILPQVPLVEAYVREKMDAYWVNSWLWPRKWEQRFVCQLLRAIRDIEQMNDEKCQQLHEKLVTYQQGFYGAMHAGAGDEALQWLKDSAAARQDHALATGHMMVMKKQLIAALFTECLKELRGKGSGGSLYQHLQEIRGKLIDDGRLEANYSKDVLPLLMEKISTILKVFLAKKPALRVGQFYQWVTSDFCQEDINLVGELQQQLISAQTAGEANSLLGAVVGRLQNASKNFSQQLGMSLLELQTDLQVRGLLPANSPLTLDAKDMANIAKAQRDYEAALQHLVPKVAKIGR